MIAKFIASSNLRTYENTSPMRLSADELKSKQTNKQKYMIPGIN